MNSISQSTLRNNRSTGWLRCVAAMLVLLLTFSAHGQSVDYGALEQLFREPVTTSVNGSPQRVSEVAATMEIITAEDIRRSGAKDIPGVLRHAGGVDTLEWGNDDIDVSVRGYDQALSPRLLVLVDGRQVYSDDYGYTPWSSVPVELAMIRQIEIIKGPSSALFGFNAAGGVINIITYNPLYDKVDTISSTGGTQGLAAGSIVTTHKFGSNAGVRLSMGGYSDNDFSTPIPVAMAITPREHEYRGAINLDTVFRINEKMQLGIEATYSLSKLNTMQPSYQIDNEHHLTDLASFTAPYTPIGRT
jgi:outer membrane receptor for ferrienterochelin and colicins